MRGIEEEIRSCVNCQLYKVGNGPVPGTLIQSKIVVIGEAPGEEDDEEGRPFVGPSGQLARRWLDDAGVDSGAVAYINVVSCFPRRTPVESEVAACKSNLERQLAFIQPVFALVLGGVAMGAWWGQVKPVPRMGEMRGKFWKDKNNIWCLATWHPNAVLRNSRLEDEALADVRRFSLPAKVPHLAEGRTKASSNLLDNDYCIKGCGEYADHYLLCDGTEYGNMPGVTGGIGWCKKHWEFRGKK